MIHGKYLIEKYSLIWQHILRETEASSRSCRTRTWASNMFVYLILLPESTRPELGWNRQKASVSGLGSLWYAKKGYGLMAKGEPVFLWNSNKPLIVSEVAGLKAPEEGGSDWVNTAMECTVETLIFPPSDAALRAFWTFCIAGKSCDIRFWSVELMTSLPTVMRIILLAG